jgi:hypothetical protein
LKETKTMTGYSEETRVRELLAPLSRIEPLQAPTHRDERPLRRPVIAAAIAAAILAAAGVAIAAGIGAFNGISAAQHQKRAADMLDPATARFLRHGLSGIVLDSARLVSRLPSGRRIYVATNADANLCVVIEQQMASCGPNLARTHPTTMATFRRSPGSKPISYGVALDGVTAISFKAGGKIVTVPVKDNVWAYEGNSSIMRWAKVHFDDGTTLVVE